MSLALVKLGFERPKESFNVGLRETIIAVAWASLVIMVGMSIASSTQAADHVAYEHDGTSQGL